jgi:predicted anti-sigma-YlaC factor YlaD
VAGELVAGLVWVLGVVFAAFADYMGANVQGTGLLF